MSNSDESNEFGEGIPHGNPGTPTTYLTLPKAIEFGEYEPDHLGMFAEWHQLTHQMQFELVKQGLDNRRRQLLKQWAEINNVLDYSKKPHLQAALRSIEAQMKAVDTDRERLYVQFSLG